MIKINLLGVPKPKRGKRSGGSAAPEMGGGGEGMNPLIPLVLAAAVCAGGVYIFYNRQVSRGEQIASDKVKAERENRSLSEVKATFERKQREADNYRRRVEVIDQLRTSQGTGPVSLLTLVGDTVNATDAVWLGKLTDESGSIKIEGTALNVHAIANLMNNLQKTGYFKTVEMTESIQDDQKVADIAAFNFMITCEVNKAT